MEKASRRSVLRAWLAATAGGLGALAAGRGGQAQSLPATPSCGVGSPATLAGTEGPFFKPNSPVKRDFRSDARGEALTLIGFVGTSDCRPIADALVDIWHADSDGEYDNEGYRLRGHQITDAQGRYAFDTIIPAPYGRRTRHYHVKVRPPGGRLLTTQLYFPGEPGNESDFLFDRRLLMRVEAASDGKVGRFDFVLNL